MPTVPQRAIFHKAWSDPLAPAENPRSFPIGSNVRITDQALLDRIDSADVAHISANFDLTAPGDIGSGTAGNGWFNNLVVGAAALLAAGSPAAPALAASGDTNTGIYFPAADQVGIAVGGSAGLVVTPTGIGRGTTNPQRPLHIEHTGSIVAEFARSDNGQILELDGAGYSAHHTLDGTAYFIGHGSASRGLGLQTNNTTRVYIDTSGNAGFGTTSPDAALHLVSTSSLPFIAQGASSTVRFSVGNTSAPTGKRFFGLGVTSGSELTIQGLTDASTFARNLFGLSHDGGLTFYNAASAAAGVWDAVNSRFGLGMTNPAFALDVSGQLQVNHTGQQAVRARRSTTSAFQVVDYTGFTQNASSSYVASGAIGFGLGDTTALAEDGYMRITTMEGGTSRTTYSIVGASRHMWSLNNSEIMRLTTTGLALGTTSPAHMLEVNDAVNARAALFQGPSTGAEIGIRRGTSYRWSVGLDSGSDFYISNNSDNKILRIENNAGANAFYLDSTGLGLGTTSPLYALDVDGVARFSQSSGNGTIRVVSSTTGTSTLGLGDTSANLNGRIQYNNALDLMQIFASNTAIMNMDSTGVGIGTTSPAEALDVVGSIVSSGVMRSGVGNATEPGFQFVGGTNDGFFLPFGGAIGVSLDNAEIFRFTVGALRLPLGSASSPSFRTFGGGSVAGLYFPTLGVLGVTVGGSEVMRWDSSGVGIGTTSPGEALHVNGNLRIDNGSILYNGFREIRQVSVTNQGIGIQGGTSNVTGASISLYGSTNTGQAGKMFLSYGGAASTGALVIRHYNGTAFVTRAYLDDVGNLGLGTTDPQRTLHVDGTVRLQNLPTSSGGLAAGDLWNDGGTVKIV